MTRDEELATNVKEALVRDLRVSAQPIQVFVREGIVTLCGLIQSYRRKLAAEEIATSFHECRGVVNQLEVQPPGLFLDEEVANHVRAALQAHADITKEAITVSVSSGVVTLAGTVGSPWERALAEDVALGVRGVREVKSYLVVDLMEQMDDEALSRVIEAALGHARGLRNVPLRVAASGGLVVLSGEVPELWQKEVAERVAQSFQPMWLRNEIVVTGPLHPGNQSDGVS
jgi:osmotically-inducible protein OsmY